MKEFLILLIGILFIFYLYCEFRLWKMNHPQDKPKKNKIIKDIPWNYNFKVNEYYNQFGDNLKILINT